MIKGKRELTQKYDTLLLYQKFIAITDNIEAKAKIADSIKDLKKEIRAYYNQPISNSSIIKSDFDGFIEKIILPETIDTKEKAEDYFNTYVYIPVSYASYDCTGKPFTCWHRIVYRMGRFELIHSVGIDI